MLAWHADLRSRSARDTTTFNKKKIVCHEVRFSQGFKLSVRKSVTLVVSVVRIIKLFFVLFFNIRSPYFSGVGSLLNLFSFLSGTCCQRHYLLHQFLSIFCLLLHYSGKKQWLISFGLDHRYNGRVGLVFSLFSLCILRNVGEGYFPRVVITASEGETDFKPLLEHKDAKTSLF